MGWKERFWAQAQITKQAEKATNIAEKVLKKEAVQLEGRKTRFLGTERMDEKGRDVIWHLKGDVVKAPPLEPKEEWAEWVVDKAEPLRKYWEPSSTSSLLKGMEFGEAGVIKDVWKPKRKGSADVDSPIWGGKRWITFEDGSMMPVSETTLKTIAVRRGQDLYLKGGEEIGPEVGFLKLKSESGEFKRILNSLRNKEKFMRSYSSKAEADEMIKSNYIAEEDVFGQPVRSKGLVQFKGEVYEIMSPYVEVLGRMKDMAKEGKLQRLSKEMLAELKEVKILNSYVRPPTFKPLPRQSINKEETGYKPKRWEEVI